MSTYVKYTNGGVSFLVDITNQAEMDEKETAKFEIELDEDGEVVTIDSKDLVVGEDERVNSILESIKRKAEKKTAKTSTSTGTAVDSNTK